MGPRHLTVHQSEAELRASVIDMSAIKVPEIPVVKSLPTFAIDQLHQINGIQIDKLCAVPSLPVLSVPDHTSINMHVIIIMVILNLMLCLVLFVRWLKTNQKYLKWVKKRASCCRCGDQDESGAEVMKDEEHPNPTVAALENVYVMETGKPALNEQRPRELATTGPPMNNQVQAYMVHGSPLYPYPQTAPPYQNMVSAVPMDPRVASPAYNPALSGA